MCCNIFKSRSCEIEKWEETWENAANFRPCFQLQTSPFLVTNNPFCRWIFKRICFEGWVTAEGEGGSDGSPGWGATNGHVYFCCFRHLNWIRDVFSRRDVQVKPRPFLPDSDCCALRTRTRPRAHRRTRMQKLHIAFTFAISTLEVQCVREWLNGDGGGASLNIDWPWHSCILVVYLFFFFFQNSGANVCRLSLGKRHLRYELVLHKSMHRQMYTQIKHNTLECSHFFSCLCGILVYAWFTGCCNVLPVAAVLYGSTQHAFNNILL